MPASVPSETSRSESLHAVDRQKLLSWGFPPDAVPAALERLQNPGNHQNLVVDFGTTALDVKHAGQYEDDPFMGDLALIGQDDRVIGSGEAFVEPDESLQVDGHTGGIANAAYAVARVLEAEARERMAVGNGVDHTRRRVWALIARLGRDRAGQIYKSKIPQSVIDVSGLRPVSGGAPSGLADIRIQQKPSDRVKKGDRAIYFRAGASGATRPTKEDLLEIARRNPFNFNISYPGLFPDGMDADQGKSLSRFIWQVQEMCPMVSMDIHGFTKMHHIRQALTHVDLFNANLVEAARVFLEEKVDAAQGLSGEERHALQKRVLGAIWPYFDAPMGRTRMFTITDARGCFVIFQAPGGRLQADDVPSSCAAIPAKDKTGAGDVRYGLQRFWIARERANEWKDGRFNMQSAVLAAQIGQIATTLHVQGRKENALEGVTLQRLTRVAGSGEQFKTLRGLRTALRRH